MLIAALVMSLALAGEPEATTSVQDAGEATAPDVARPVKSPSADGDRLVCRREAKPNSRFTTKVCKTAVEWEARAEAARRAFAETQERPMVNIGKGN